MAVPMAIVGIVSTLVCFRFNIVAAVEIDDRVRRLNEPTTRETARNFEVLPWHQELPLQSHNKDGGERKLSNHGSSVGGTPATLGQYPFYVRSTGTTLCGGTLIYEDIVLTAGHCQGAFLDGAVVGGITRAGSDGSVVRVEQEFRHPKYYRPNPNQTPMNDIMLLKLSAPSTAPWVTLNLDRTVPAVGQTLSVIGFGTTSSGGNISNTLIQVDVDTYSDAFCVGYYTIFDPATMICAGTRSGESDSCQGDWGGPLMSPDLVQVGIVSAGNGCAQANVPSIYADVAFYKTFIRNGICEHSSNPPTSCTKAHGPTPVPGGTLTTIVRTANVPVSVPAASPFLPPVFTKHKKSATLHSPVSKHKSVPPHSPVSKHKKSAPPHSPVSKHKKSAPPHSPVSNHKSAPSHAKHAKRKSAPAQSPVTPPNNSPLYPTVAPTSTTNAPTNAPTSTTNAPTNSPTSTTNAPTSTISPMPTTAAPTLPKKVMHTMGKRNRNRGGKGNGNSIFKD